VADEGNGASAAGGAAGAPAELVLERLTAGGELAQVLERMVRRRADLGLVQFQALRLLAGREPEPTQPSDLMRTSRMSSAHATTVLNQLEARGLVARLESAEDRRRRLVRLTPAGHAALARARPALALLEERLVAAVGPDGPADALGGELRKVRLALRQALALDDWESCVGP
jgi:DNA-binding MarR family transcriptional regulator